ncbi:MAG: MFS transporter [Nitrososphaeria archaeon]|nr:MFS transporter [Nitrososphaeria archaeon]NIQ34167.1 MFS transporter [Nitrososphaeria archaeon]
MSFKKRGLWKEEGVIFKPKGMIWLLGLIQFLITLSWQNISAVLPVLQLEWGLDGSAAGILLSSTGIGFSVGALASGYLSDRLGGRPVFSIFSLMCGVFGMLFAVYADNYALGVLLRTLVGLGLSGSYLPGMLMLAEEYPPRDRGKTLGLFTSFFTAGVSASYYITGLVTATLGWRAGMFITAFLSIPASLLNYSMRIGDTVRERGGKRHGGIGFRAGLLRDKIVWLMTLAYMSHCWEMLAVRIWLIPYLNAWTRLLGYGVREALAVSSVLGGTVVLSSVVFPGVGGWLSDRVGRYRSIVLFTSASGLIAVLFGWLMGQPLYTLYLVGPLYFFFAMLDSAISKASITETVSAEHVGSVLGLMTLFGQLAGVVSISAFGWVLDQTNDLETVASLGYFPIWGWAFTFLGVIALIAPFVIYLFMRGEWRLDPKP